MNYNKLYFINYLHRVMFEMDKRKIKYQEKFYNEIYEFCKNGAFVSNNLMYDEHNNRYLTQCYYNLQEKYDRGIITKDEFYKISESYVLNLSAKE